MIKGPHVLALGMIGAALLHPSVVYARACADFDIQESQANDNYNPFSAASFTRGFTMTVRKLSNDSNNIRFILIDEDPRNGELGFDSAGPLIYDVQWLQDRGRRIISNGHQMIDRTNSVAIALPSSEGRSVNVGFQLLIPRGQVSRPGDHRQRLTVRFACFQGNDQVGAEYEQSDQRVTLELTTRRFVSAYVGGVGQSTGRIDFGDISPTSGALTRTISVTALGTSAYDVRVDSDNGGKIVRDSADSDDNRRVKDGIAYAMRFAGRPVTSGQKLACPNPVVPTGSSSDLELALNQSDIGAVPAGTYRDTITLTFQPRDSVWNDSCAVVSGSSER